MTFVTDPDDLDRFQVIYNPFLNSNAGGISIRGLGTAQTAKSTAGDVTGASAFEALGETFQSDGVVAGSILAIASGNNAGHYTVATVPTETTLTINEVFPDAGEAAGQTFKINAPEAAGGGTPAVADGVLKQALYSFTKEEWRTFDTGLFLAGEAPDLFKFNFPYVTITREQFEMGDASPVRQKAWAYVDQTTRDLIRTGGWTDIDVNGNIKKEESGVITVPGDGIDSDAQAYYQQHAADADPLDFVLTGPVNQAINIFDEVTGPDGGTGFAITTSNTIARNDGGNWFDDGYRAGGLITIRDADTPANDGTWTILSVQDAVDGDLVVVGTPLTNDAVDQTMVAAVNKRAFLKLRVRKKARTYAESDIAAIGVSTLETIVNRYPLAHVNDPAITFDDGDLVGDGTASTQDFQQVETHATDTNGNTASNGDGTFAFVPLAAPTPAFNDGVLRVGDSLEITTGTYQGVFEIAAINGAGDVDLFEEPLLGAAPTQAADNLTYTTRTAVRDSGLTNATLTDVDGLTGTLDSVGSTFTTDGGLGDRIVAAGDMVLVTAGDASAIGVYKVSSVTDADTLVLNTSDQPITGGPHTNQTFIVLRPGMHAQYKNVVGTPVTPTVNFDDADATFAGSPPTIVRSAGSWVTDGFVVGGAVVVADAAIAGNNGTFAIVGIDQDTTPNDTLILALTDEGLSPIVDDTADAITATPRVGFIRTLNQDDYSFNWRMFGNGGNLSESFQWIQRQLRRGRAGLSTFDFDIDKASTVSRGDVTDPLMAFASPNGTGLNMFIDDLDGSVKNNATFEDLTGEGRNFAFIAGITININPNIVGDTAARLTVYFEDPDGTPSTGDEFNTDGAIIVDANDTTDMDFAAPLTDPVLTDFDYDNNAQGGRTPGTDAPIVIVAIGLNTAQHVKVTGTIQRIDNNVFSVTAPLERVYQNV